MPGAAEPSDAAAPPVRLSWGARWSDRWRAWRDRLYASPTFQRRAASFALTRPAARGRARQLFDLVAGFVYSQVLLACVRLRVFEQLAAGPQSAQQLAATLQLPLDATQRLLDAAVALRLLEHRGPAAAGADSAGGKALQDRRYGLGALGAPMVGNAALVAMVEHHAALYDDLADPVALLRRPPAERQHNALARYWAYDAARDGTVATTDADPAARGRIAAYSALMAASQPLVADEILDAHPLHKHRCLLDVGGGDGSFLVSASARAPRLRLMLFDLPAVADAARQRLAAAGLAARASVHGGSFLHDALPRGADVISLVRVVHDHDDAPALGILRAAHAALPIGGTLLLAEPMAGTPGAQAMGDAYFGIYLLAMGRGRPRSRALLSRMLQEAGFDTVHARATRVPLQTQLLVARRLR